MRPDSKSASFTFHRNVLSVDADAKDVKDVKNCRRKLQKRFDQDDGRAVTVDRNDRSVLSVLSFNDPRRVLRTGAERLSKTFSQMCTTFGTFSQRFRVSTKRRQRLDEGPETPRCVTPQTRTRRVLGRTPTKMYSPFSIESPAGVGSRRTDDKENALPPVPARKKKVHNRNVLPSQPPPNDWDIFGEAAGSSSTCTSQSLIVSRD